MGHCEMEYEVSIIILVKSRLYSIKRPSVSQIETNIL